MPNHSIEDPFVIVNILSHLEARYRSQGPENRRPGAREQPTGVWGAEVRSTENVR